MSARLVPTVPQFLAGQKLTATGLNQLGTWMNFWADRPMFSMYQSVAQSIPNSTYTQLTDDTLDYDSDSGRGGSSPWSYTIPVGMGGRWKFATMISYAGNATGIRIAAIFKNGTQVNGANWSYQAGPAGNVTNIFGSKTFSVNAGDVIGVYAWHNITGGGALSTNVGFSFPSYFEGSLESLANP